jgi:tetratricopeptide (TPR) repeat protein
VLGRSRYITRDDDTHNGVAREMGESFKSEGAVREYLLGRVSDEATLEGLEEFLFTDEEFCTRVEVTEDELVNDYVLGYLNEEDASSFKATLADNPDRRFKLELTRALREKALAERAKSAKESKVKKDEKETYAASPFLDSLRAFFRRPAYAGAFAVLLVALLAASFYLFRGGRADSLAELRAIYTRERPTETRVYGFGYAPLTQLRGDTDAGDRNRLRRIENDLIEAAEKSPNSETRHALGVFYLMQQKYADAKEELEAASKLDERDARIHNDLGAAYFGLAKSSAQEKRLEARGRALEEFTRATELDADSLEALFNRSLALQEFGLLRRAKESWTLYLQKDSSSPWAEEARKNLARLDEARARLVTNEKVLNERVLRDFLGAYRVRDRESAEKIHDATKGLLRGATVPLQLTRRYLAAKLGGDETTAKESLEALAFVGDFERARHSEFFFLNSPTSTRTRARTSLNDSCAPETSSTKGSASCSTAGRTTRGATTSRPSRTLRVAVTSSNCSATRPRRA